MKRFRLIIKVYVRTFERDNFHALIHAERRRKRVVKKMKQ